MKFKRIIPDYDHLWAVELPEQQTDALTQLFRDWTDVNYLLDFFTANMEDLRIHFHMSRISTAITDTREDAMALQRMIVDFPATEHLDESFHPLGEVDMAMAELAREKARNWDRRGHASWLRVYAIRLEPNVYVVTGGAIKLTAKMQDRPHTLRELSKLNACRAYLLNNGVFDKDSFMDSI